MEFITKIFTFIMQAISSDTIRGTLLILFALSLILVCGKLYSKYSGKRGYFRLMISLALVLILPIGAGIFVLMTQFNYIDMFYDPKKDITMFEVLLVIFSITLAISWIFGYIIAKLCAKFLYKDHTLFSGITDSPIFLRSIGNTGGVIISVLLVVLSVSGGMISISLSDKESEASYSESIELVLAVIEQSDANVPKKEIKEILEKENKEKPETDLQKLRSSSDQIVMVYNMFFLIFFLMFNNINILSIVIRNRMKKLAKECPTSPTNENPVDKDFSDVVEKDTVGQGNSSKYVGPVDKVLPQAIVCDTTKQVNEFTAGKSESKKNLIQDSKDVPADKSINRMVVNAVVFSSAVGIIYLYKKFK